MTLFQPVTYLLNLLHLLGIIVVEVIGLRPGFSLLGVIWMFFTSLSSESILAIATLILSIGDVPAQTEDSRNRIIVSFGLLFLV